MFIYHFNRLIHNRVLWILFAVVVAFAFLSVDSCSSTPGGNGPAAGTLGGKPVDAGQFALAERFVGGGRSRPGDMPPALVETQAWQHLAALQAARSLHLDGTPDEIRQAIRETPAFSNQGQFDPRRFQQVIQQSLGVDVGTYQKLMADQIALAKLSQAIGAASLVSPMEIEDELASWTDQFTIRIATISNTFDRAELPLEEGELQAYYDAHRERFARPDRVAVHYAAMDVTNFSAAVTVHEDDIVDYYDANASQYTHPGTNDTLVTRPLDEVRDEIVSALTLDEARYAAGTNVAAFMESLSPDDGNQFAWRSKARRMQVGTTPLFAAEDFVPGIEPAAQEAFREAAFDLDPARLDARLAVVPGDRQVYLLMVWTNSPAFTPSFEEVREPVVPLALAEARADAFQALCTAKRNAVRADMDQGTGFAAAAGAAGLAVSTSQTFSVQAASRTAFPDAVDLIPVAMRLRPGELSDTVLTRTGGHLIHVEARQPGDALATELARPQVRDALIRRRETALFTEWMAWNLKRIGFHSERLAYAADAAADEADSEE